MSQTADTLPKVQWWKIALGVAFGVSISGYFIATTIKPESLRQINFNYHLLVGLLIAALTVVIRDFAFMYKVRLSTGQKLSWRSVLRIVILWEFGSAITPGSVGGIAFAFFLMKREGISLGRGTAAVMLNTFLDNIAFVVVFSILYWVLGKQMFVVSANCPDLAGHTVLQGVRSLVDKAWIGYLVFAGAALFFGIALFALPHTTKMFFGHVAQWRIAKYFRNGLIYLGEEIEITSREYKQQNLWFWARMVIATFINWMARYALANALMFAFSNVPLNMLQIFARQYVLWVFLVIPSTPGASGLAEMGFMAMNCEFIPGGLAAAVALVWRLYNYYLYIVLGSLLLPKWITDVVASAQNKNK